MLEEIEADRAAQLEHLPGTERGGKRIAIPRDEG
jgi:hypothetical protein